MVTKANGLEGAIYAGLETLTNDKLGREWQCDDGAALRIERCLIDANWGASTDVVYQFCRQSAHASIVLPSHGRFVGASSQPFSESSSRVLQVTRIRMARDQGGGAGSPGLGQESRPARYGSSCSPRAALSAPGVRAGLLLD
jgi:hypothetical protein